MSNIVGRRFAWILGLHWNGDITVGDILTLVGFTLTVTGLLVANVQIRRNRMVDRARFLVDITERYFHDDDIRRFWYQLDYGQFIFDPFTFTLSDEERWMDNLLYQFDLTGHLVTLGVLSKEEVSIVGFQAARVLTDNPEVQKYLDWLDKEFMRLGKPTPAHQEARNLARRLASTRRSSMSH